MCVIIPFDVDTMITPIFFDGRYLFSNFSYPSFDTENLGFIAPHLFKFPRRFIFASPPLTSVTWSKLPTYPSSFRISNTFLMVRLIT